MKILAIRGRNLASLAGDFAVDFTVGPLASTGLFAISGPTGAGKSTLLDALCLALYDATPRIGRTGAGGAPLPDVGVETVTTQDTRTILRRGAAQGHAEVDFIGNDGISYRARWSVRRARERAAGKLQAKQMSLLRLPDLQPLGGALITEVKAAILTRIGLSFDQFTRAVLLAQNEFSAFLKAPDDDRARLLQALTGTDQFEAISLRAFERNKSEQDTLRLIEARASGATPFDAATRQQWDETRQQRHAVAVAQEQQVRAHEAQLRWHDALDAALQKERDAAAGASAAQVAQAAAAPRRRDLARSASAEQARPLLTDVDRLASDGAAQRQAVAVAAQRLERARTEATATRARAQQATAGLAATRQAQASTEPALSVARQLDANIAALAPHHAAAVRECTQSTQAQATAEQKATRLRQEDQARRDAHRETARWLADHSARRSAGEEWPRWESWLDDAVAALARATRAQTDVASAVQRQASRLQVHENAIAHFARDSATEGEAEARLRTCAAEQAKADRDAVLARKLDADLRREQLRIAAAAWRDLVTAQHRISELRSEARTLERKRDAHRQRLDEAGVARDPALALAQQAERAWTLAYLATQANVEALRTALEPGSPCAVCGATEHPYAHAAPLQTLLGELEAERERTRAAVTAIDHAISSLQALLAEQASGLLALSRREEAMQAECDAALRQWNALPIAGEFAHVAEPDRTAWLDAQNTAAAQAQQAAATQEMALRALDRARADAQQQLDMARAKKQLAAEELHRADAGRQTAALQHGTAVEAHAASVSQLDSVLDKLEHAGMSEVAGAEWRSAWRSAPAAWQQARRAEALAWQQQRQRLTELEQALTSGATELRAASESVAHATAQHQAAQTRLVDAEGKLKQLRAARDDVFADTAYAGQPVGTIDTALRDAIVVANEEHEKQQLAHQESERQHTRAIEAARQSAQQLETLEVQHGLAVEKLSAWLAAWQPDEGEPADGADDQTRDGEDGIDNRDGRDGRDGGSDSPHAPLAPNLDILRRSLSHDAAWLASERDALDTLGRTVLATSVVAQERRAAREAIEASRNTTASRRDVEALLGTATMTLEAAKQALAEADLTLRQDDARRATSAALLEEIGSQQQIARVWQSMNELIGSADGKKFRNYAQQLTLDILLGYANAHLATLSRRYRLERVKQTLGLLVIDQDMADEIRSVHSLSGGESFLVSLALALGLASLSSHRVRVESLFIDEGFGSLDADTLRVAMDALDTLQAQGRKVGVISHVHEMTERIGTRIAIQRMAGGQSRVVVEG